MSTATTSGREAMYLAPHLCILCIDDAHDLLNMMKVILRRAGHEVNVALDGDTGIQMLRRMPSIDVLLINHQMPRVSGIDVVAFVATHPRFDHIGVIFDSAAIMPKWPVNHVAWSRVDVMLRLPFRPDDLVRAVQQAYAVRRSHFI
jgi:CheY-like chemotaxis protein